MHFSELEFTVLMPIAAGTGDIIFYGRDIIRNNTLNVERAHSSAKRAKGAQCWVGANS